MNYKLVVVIKYVILLTFISCIRVDVSKLHPGPVYCAITSEGYDLHAEIEDVVTEFNNQLGYEFFTDLPSIDIIVFHMLPVDTIWPVRMKDGKQIVALSYHNTILFKYTMFTSSDYMHHLITHEIGHALGIQHSNDVNDVMFEDIDESRLIDLKTAVKQVIDRTNLRLE